MDHTQFKANQTAAAYVAEGLDEQTQEAFELHMMGCRECLADVEVWRAIKLDMRAAPTAERQMARTRRLPAFTDWRMAASLVGAGVVGAAGGWLGKSTQVTDVDSNETVVFNVPGPSRGTECTPVQLTKDTRTAVLRVPGLSRDTRVVVLDADGHELSGGRATSRVQPDGSQLLRIDADVLRGRTVRLEARSAEGSSEPLGCLTGESASHPADRTEKP